MKRASLTYATILLVMLAIDLFWLGVVATPLYQRAIGHLMAPQPNIPAALLFYLLYPVGLLVFDVRPHGASRGVRRSLLMGGLFGFFAYGTYDLTNLATLSGWPWSLSIVDMAWGTFVSAVSAAAGKWMLDRTAGQRT